MFHEDGPTSVLEILRNARDWQKRSRGLGNLKRIQIAPVVNKSGGEATVETKTQEEDEVGDRQKSREPAERREKKALARRRDRRIRQSNGGFSTDDKDTGQRSPTLYFALDDQGTSTAENGGLRPPVGF